MEDKDGMEDLELNKELRIEIRKNLSDNNFNLGVRLGQGAFSVVYGVAHKITNEIFAAKIITKNQLKYGKENPDIIIGDEVASMKSVLRFNGVVRYFTDFHGDYFHIIVMEYCRNTLKSIMENTNNGNGLNEKLILLILKQILAALYHVHELSILHNDLKPSNIYIVDDNFSIKLGDLGISFVLQSDITSTLRTEPMGTRRYCAPEITESKGGKGIFSQKSDIFSVGVILVDMIFGGDKIEENNIKCDKNIDIILEKIKNENKTKKFNDIIGQYLNKNRDKRPTCIKALEDPIFRDAKAPYEMTSSSSRLVSSLTKSTLSLLHSNFINLGTDRPLFALANPLLYNGSVNNESNTTPNYSGNQSFPPAPSQ